MQKKNVGANLFTQLSFNCIYVPHTVFLCLFKMELDIMTLCACMIAEEN